MASFTFSGFGDEASSDLAGQLAALQKAGNFGLDVRNVDGINVLEMSESELYRTRKACEDAGVTIQSVGSPVNKVPLGENTLDTELPKLRHAIKAAEILGTSRIRIFTPEVSPERVDRAWPEVAEIISVMVHAASAANIVLLHENDAKYYGAYPALAKRLFEKFGGPTFRAAFDFANTVLLGFQPMTDWFPWLTPHLDTLHIKDAVVANQEIVAAGEGDAEILATLTYLKAAGWTGTLTLEPHLQSAGPYGGFSGEELFAYAAKKMMETAKKAGILPPKALRQKKAAHEKSELLDPSLDR